MAGELVGVWTELYQVFQIVGARSLDYADSYRLAVARLRRQSEELDGTDEMAACRIGLLRDELTELELALQTQRMCRYATYYGAISWDIGR